jgi:hypothetical protein
LSAVSKEIPSYSKIELNNKGEVRKVESLTSIEYLALKEKIVKDSQGMKIENSEEVN